MHRLIKIQQGLIAPKGQYNNFGKYKYRSCEDIMVAVKPLLFETQTSLIISDEIVLIGDRIYVKATATLIANEGQTIASASGFAREPEAQKGMNEAQITGSASSYARKYACNGLFLIDDVKDADSTNKHGKDDPKPKDHKAPLKKELTQKEDPLKDLAGSGEKRDCPDGKLKDVAPVYCNKQCSKREGCAAWD